MNALNTCESIAVCFSEDEYILVLEDFLIELKQIGKQIGLPAV